MPRNIPTILTSYDIRNICSAATVDTYARSGAISALRPAQDSTLVGQELRFTLDSGETMVYRFERQRVLWSDGGAFHEEYAEFYAAGREGLYFVHHLKTNAFPYGAMTLVLDLAANSVTCVDMVLGTIKSNRDVQRTVKFGVIGDGACAHQLTDDLSGVVMDWKYAEGVIIHEMFENWSCNAFVSPPPLPAPEWADFFSTFNPTKYVHVQDQLYFITFYAPGASGVAVDVLMDLRSMTCVGSFFGIDNADTLRSYTFGGKGAYADVAFIGRYTVE